MVMFAVYVISVPRSVALCVRAVSVRGVCLPSTTQVVLAGECVRECVGVCVCVRTRVRVCECVRVRQHDVIVQLRQVDWPPS